MPPAFANLMFNGEQHFTTTSDIDGKFTISSTEKITSVSCTYVGYEKFSSAIKQDSQLLIISLTSSNSLDEIVIKPGENPENRIIRKVIENKQINNPENISSIQYKSYNKIVYDL